MKNTHLLLSLSTAVLLTACGGGGGGGGGISATTNPTGGVSGLTQNYTVPASLKSQVAAAKRKIFWEKDPTSAADTMKETINGKTHTYKVKDIIDYNKLPQGLTNYNAVYDYKERKYTSKGKIYNMPYSLIMGDTTIEEFNKKTNQPNALDEYDVLDAGVMGLRTQNLPSAGTATYTGVAMDKQSVGKFSMLVDFNNNAVVQGSLTGLSQGNITLKRAVIKPVVLEDIFDHPDVTSIGFKGEATGVKLFANGNTTIYEGHFFGPNAEEVGGVVDEYSSDGHGGTYYTGTHAVFGGQRGEIKK